MKYELKQCSIDAFQYDGDLMNNDCNYYVPLWAIDAYRDGILFYKEGKCFIHNTNSTDIEVNVGDYIIKKSNNEITVSNEILFNNKYGIVKNKIERVDS